MFGRCEDVVIPSLPAQADAAKDLNRRNCEEL
jgi:hypothetical protein